MISITNFEQIIDSKIVDRGRAYYDDDCVGHMEKIGDDHYIAEVVGTEDYEVEILLENDLITTHFCTCPYDYGEFCKHEVAVLFSILDQYKTIEADIVESKLQKIKSGTEAKPHQKIDVFKMLDMISHKELKDFVFNYIGVDRQFKDKFIRDFAVVSKNSSFELYQKQVKDIYKSGKGRDGFIEWHQMRKVGKQLLAFLSDVEKYLGLGNLDVAFEMSTALLEESIAAAQFCDDSEGYLSEIADGCFRMLDTIALADIDDEFRDMFLKHCLNIFDQQKFKGWDFHVQMLILAAKLIKNTEESELILIRIPENSEGDNYYFTKLESLKYEILLKWKTKEEAEQFLDKNLNNYELRAKAIFNAVNNFDYEKAKKITQEGIVFDKKEKPGLVKKWYNWLLRIAELENDKQNIILYARYLFKDNFYPERDYYEILKQHVPEKDWQKFVDEIISDILNQNRYYGNRELVASVYIKEKRWEKLLELIKKSYSLNFLEIYEEYINHLFPEEIINLYIEFMNIEIKNATSRSGYKNVCKYLKKIKKMGANEKVKEVINDYKIKFPKKRALIEELDKI